MMYSNYAFSKNERKTMVARNGKVLLPAYSKSTLDESDIERVNLLYECKLVKKDIEIKKIRKISRISKILKPILNSI